MISPTASESTHGLPTFVIGAGATGLAVAKELKYNRIPFQVLEAHDEIGGLWNRSNAESPAYLNLTTNSSKSTTYLDKKAPISWPCYFSHERALQYLEDFANRHQLCSDIRLSSRVTRIESSGQDQWKVHYSDRRSGQHHRIEGRAVVVCTGIHRRPNQFIPGDLLQSVEESDIGYIHSSEYQDYTPFKGKRVVVVGFGNSAADIATEISAVADKTFISTRSVPWIIPLWVVGLPADRVFHLLQRIYVGHPDDLGIGKIQHDLLDRLPVSNRGIMRAIRQQRIQLRGSIQRIGKTSVRFNGGKGADEQVDHLIFATGYRRHFPILDEYLFDPLVHDDDPFPLLVFHPEKKNLFFTSEVNVPQGVWPLFAGQARAIAAYLEADAQPGKNFFRFNLNRKARGSGFKGNLFRCEDRFHVDPDIYAGRLAEFSHWIKR